MKLNDPKQFIKERKFITKAHLDVCRRGRMRLESNHKTLYSMKIKLNDPKQFKKERKLFNKINNSRK